MTPAEATKTGEPRMEATAKPRLARGLNALLGDLASAPAEGAALAQAAG